MRSLGIYHMSFIPAYQYVVEKWPYYKKWLRLWLKENKEVELMAIGSKQRNFEKFWKHINDFKAARSIVLLTKKDFEI